MKKLLSKNDIEDALKRLDTLTTEEARMAIAETLKVANRVDDTVNRVDDTVNRVDDTVSRVDDKVDKVLDKVDDKVDRVDDKVDKVDEKVTVLIDGGQTAFLIIYVFLNKDIARCERGKHSYTPFCGHH
jgi:hypothetical protein